MSIKFEKRVACKNHPAELQPLKKIIKPSGVEAEVPDREAVCQQCGGQFLSMHVKTKTGSDSSKDTVTIIRRQLTGSECFVHFLVCFALFIAFLGVALGEGSLLAFIVFPCLLALTCFNWIRTDGAKSYGWLELKHKIFGCPIDRQKANEVGWVKMDKVLAASIKRSDEAFQYKVEQAIKAIKAKEVLKSDEQ